MTEFRMVLPDDRDGGWLRLIDGTDSVVATEVIAGAVAELVGRLVPGDVVNVLGDVLDDDRNGEISQIDHKPHRCGDSHANVWRMVMAMCDGNEPGYQQVLVNELGSCVLCFRNALNAAVYLYANSFALRAGSNKKAADAAAKEIARSVGL
jgi:hypothetical protein